MVTVSGNWYEPAFVCTLLALGADNILFAADWPYESNRTAMEFRRAISVRTRTARKSPTSTPSAC